MMDSRTGLKGLQIVDLGLGMAAALVTKFLREAGASITRVEPPAGDPFYEVYPAYSVWRRDLERDPAASNSSAKLDELLSKADVCIVGGEDYPGVDWRRSAADLHARHPRLVVLDIEGYPAGTQHSGRPAADVLVQARSGLAHEHYSRRPLLMGFEPSSYGATLHGLCGLLAALVHRESTGRGQVVSTSLYEGSLSWTLLLWCDVAKPTPATDFVMPKDPWPLIFRCADGAYVQVVLGSAGSKGRLYHQVLRIDDPTVDINDSGMPKPTADSKNFFGDIDVLQKHIETWQSQDLLKAVWAAGLPAEPILPPGGCWDDAQVQHNGIIVKESDGVRHVGHPLSSRASPAPRNEMPRDARLPLTGVRVIDFGAFVAGPYTSAILADFGADVVKVEPMTGDPNRSIFRSWTSVNRSKRCITIDLKTPEGLKIAQQLCVASDVVTSNFRPGVSARLGIDAKTLQNLKPSLIVLESAAYGTTGPRADGAGFDMCFQALCGHDFRGGGTGNPPLWNRTSMVDFAAGLIGAVGVLQHLYQRARTGAGAELGAGLLNAGLYLLSELVQRPDGTFEGAPPVNAQQTGYHPAEQLYEAADGWVAIAARGDAMARRLLDVLRLGGSISAPRSSWGNDVAASIATAVRRWKASELCAALNSASVWAEACRPDGERRNLQDADLVRLGTICSAEHPKFGTVRQIGPLARLSGAALGARTHAPLPGEHTDAILAELGFSQAAVADLRERKVVK